MLSSRLEAVSRRPVAAFDGRKLAAKIVAKMPCFHHATSISTKQRMDPMQGREAYALVASSTMKRRRPGRIQHPVLGKNAGTDRRR
jgi:hypothetical protein